MAICSIAIATPRWKLLQMEQGIGLSPKRGRPQYNCEFWLFEIRNNTIALWEQSTCEYDVYN